MQIIKDIVMDIKDEIKDADRYAKMAVQYKDDDRQLADTFAKIATMRLDAITMLHSHAARIMKAYKAEHGETPVAMQAVYNYEHENQIEWVAKIKALLEMYREG